MIGHLQRNKIARTIPIIRLLHSLDSLRLAQALSLESKTLELTLPVLVEVNVTEDGAKTGLPATQLTSFFDQVAGLPHLRIQGLMAMSSLAADSSAIQREFEQVRLLRDQIQRQFVGMCQLNELSMGMSGDYREAIAQGATIVRIGSLLWEGILN